MTPAVAGPTARGRGPAARRHRQPGPGAPGAGHRAPAAAADQRGHPRAAAAPGGGRLRRRAAGARRRRGRPRGAQLRPRRGGHRARTGLGAHRCRAGQRRPAAAAVPRRGRRLRPEPVPLAGLAVPAVRPRRHHAQRPEPGQRRVPGRPRRRADRLRPGLARATRCGTWPARPGCGPRCGCPRTPPTSGGTASCAGCGSWWTPTGWSPSGGRGWSPRSCGHHDWMYALVRDGARHGVPGFAAYWSAGDRGTRRAGPDLAGRATSTRCAPRCCDGRGRAARVRAGLTRPGGSDPPLRAARHTRHSPRSRRSPRTRGSPRTAGSPRSRGNPRRPAARHRAA